MGKIFLAQHLGPQAAWDNRNSIYLASAAGAEFVADLFLCPLEAVRIRSVSDAAFPRSLPGGLARIVSTEGVLGLYAGLGELSLVWCCFWAKAFPSRKAPFCSSRFRTRWPSLPCRARLPR